MKPRIISGLVALSCLFGSFNSKGQNVIDATVLTTAIQNSDSTVNAIFHITVSDTSNISQIEVQLGTSSGSTNLLNSNFGFDTTPLLPFIYTRLSNKIILEIGSILAAPYYYANVRTKDLNGAWSNSYEFVFN